MPEGHSLHRLAIAVSDHFAGQVVTASSPQGRFADGAALLSGMRALPAQAWGKHLFVPFISAGVDGGLATDPEATTIELPEIELGSDLPRWLHVHLGLYGAWTFQGDETFTTSLSTGANRFRIGEGDDKTTIFGQDHSVAAVARENFASTSTPGSSVTFGAQASLPDKPQKTSAKANTQAPVVGPWTPPEPRGAVRLRLETEHGVGDLNGPNRCEILTGAEVRSIIDRLGPDPLRNDDGDRAEFIRRAKRRNVPIGQLVMDQHVTAGPGNIYRAECLFRVGINPYRLGSKVSTARLGALWDDLALTMRDGLATGKIITIDDELAPAEPIDGDAEASRWAVYHRQGRPCLRCGTVINEASMQARRLFWCPGCQR